MNASRESVPTKRPETQRLRSSPVGSFGEKLKREREMRAITLEEIAEATKIGTRSLRALEEEHFDQLPGGIFNKGFVRAYARFLGIDEEQAVADYMTATNEVGTSTSTQLAALAEQVEQHRAAKEAGQENSGSTAMMLAAIVAIVIVCGVGFGGYKVWKLRQQQKTNSAAAEMRHKSVSPPASLSTPVPSTTAPSSGSTAATMTEATDVTNSTAASTPAVPPPALGSTAKSSTSPEFPITVTLKAVKASWIQVNADGKVVYSQTMGPNDQQVTLHGKDKMQLTLGNAGGVELSFNGKTLGPLGQEGQTRKLTITPQGMEP
jgi:cytoskeleton protein RodZ